MNVVARLNTDADTLQTVALPGFDVTTQLGVNFKEAVWIIKHAVGIIEEKGPIINISSYAGSRGVLGLAGYGASKAALESLRAVQHLVASAASLRGPGSDGQ
jgi:NAD(P)-dependent dehydrogenase (short-subunit alcohol dehydrogenase family)